jgi:hypothetical protein
MLIPLFLDARTQSKHTARDSYTIKQNVCAAVLLFRLIVAVHLKEEEGKGR